MKYDLLRTSGKAVGFFSCSQSSKQEHSSRTSGPMETLRPPWKVHATVPVSLAAKCSFPKHFHLDFQVKLLLAFSS